MFDMFAREVRDLADHQAVERFVDRFTQVLVDAGMPRIASRIVATLLSTDSARLTAAELAERVVASPAAISGGVRYLAAVGMINRGREPGTRRDYYTVEGNIWYQSISRRDQLMSRWSGALRDGAKALGASTPAGARLVESAEFFEFLQTELALVIERWEARRPGGGPP
jgi:hypothetical protein